MAKLGEIEEKVDQDQRVNVNNTLRGLDGCEIPLNQHMVERVEPNNRQGGGNFSNDDLYD